MCRAGGSDVPFVHFHVRWKKGTHLSVSMLLCERSAGLLSQRATGITLPPWLWGQAGRQRRAGRHPDTGTERRDTQGQRQRYRHAFEYRCACMYVKVSFNYMRRRPTCMVFVWRGTQLKPGQDFHLQATRFLWNMRFACT